MLKCTIWIKLDMNVADKSVLLYNIYGQQKLPQENMKKDMNQKAKNMSDDGKNA